MFKKVSSIKKKMDFENLKKIDLEHAVASGPLKVTENKVFGPVFDLQNIQHGLSGKVRGKDLVVYIKYFPEENRYGFSVYREKD